MVRIIKITDIAGCSYSDLYDRSVDGWTYPVEPPAPEDTPPTPAQLRKIEAAPFAPSPVYREDDGEVFSL